MSLKLQCSQMIDLDTENELFKRSKRYKTNARGRIIGRKQM